MWSRRSGRGFEDDLESSKRTRVAFPETLVFCQIGDCGTYLERDLCDTRERGVARTKRGSRYIRSLGRDVGRTFANRNFFQSPAVRDGLAVVLARRGSAPFFHTHTHTHTLSASREGAVLSRRARRPSLDESASLSFQTETQPTTCWNFRSDPIAQVAVARAQPKTGYHLSSVQGRFAFRF